MTNLFAITLPTTSFHALWVVVWLVLVAVSSTSILILLLTRWGRSQPMRVCVVLSLLAHLLLAGYAATVRIAGIARGADESIIELALGEELLGVDQQSTAPPPDPWEQTPGEIPPEMRPVEVPQTRLPIDTDQELVLPEHLLAASQDDAAESPAMPTVLPPIRMASAQPAAQLQNSAAPQATPNKQRKISVTTPERIQSDLPDIDPQRLLDEQAPAVPADDFAPEMTQIASASPRGGSPAAPTPLARPAQDVDSAPGGGDPVSEIASAPDTTDNNLPPAMVALRNSADSEPGPSRASDERHLPDVYRLRTDKDRQRKARNLGGSPQAEAAVDGGLKWLAGIQDPDGHWNASHWGGGKEIGATDQNRQQAGSKADAGVTGLALLAFLGAGHTHMKEGPYQTTVRRGLEYLAARQRRDGSMAGDATLYASMYCHGMASFAFSEAYAMSSDDRLRPYVVRAINYTLRSQNPTTGGWRYRPGDPGDTSQLGWQVMALKSAELAGLQVPAAARRGVQRFLSSVSSGRAGGLASYRPGQAASRPMTAEALVCRLFTGSAADSLAANEAATYIIQQLPGGEQQRGEKMNFYYWYYATLALHQRQDDQWIDWNKSLQLTLISTQQTSGDLAGSWSPDTAWGRYGGRVYSTAMATLCLEVYYRFLPLYGGKPGS